MTKDFINQIGIENFLSEAQKTYALVEMANYYDLNLNEVSSLDQLFRYLTENKTHQFVFDFVIYFAAWIKKEVPAYQRTFRTCDEQILNRIAEGGSL